jgi:hypothetical protein
MFGFQSKSRLAGKAARVPSLDLCSLFGFPTKSFGKISETKKKSERPAFAKRSAYICPQNV